MPQWDNGLLILLGSGAGGEKFGGGEAGGGADFELLGVISLSRLGIAGAGGGAGGLAGVENWDGDGDRRAGFPGTVDFFFGGCPEVRCLR